MARTRAAARPGEQRDLSALREADQADPRGIDSGERAKPGDSLHDVVGLPQPAVVRPAARRPPAHREREGDVAVLRIAPRSVFDERGAVRSRRRPAVQHQDRRACPARDLRPDQDASERDPGPRKHHLEAAGRRRQGCRRRRRAGTPGLTRRGQPCRNHPRDGGARCWQPSRDRSCALEHHRPIVVGRAENAETLASKALEAGPPQAASA